MFLDRLKQAFAAFFQAKDDGVKTIDDAIAQHASDVSDANKKLWDTIRGERDAGRSAGEEAQVKAGEFIANADSIESEQQQLRQLAATFVQSIDPPPDAPAGFGESTVTE